MLTERQATKHVRLWATLAAPEDIRKGAGWYRRASKFALHVSRTYGVAYVEVCAVIAALSPQCPWRANLIATLDLIREGAVRHELPVLPANIAKAKRILEDRETPIDTLLGKGPKVRAFFENIVAPELSNAVTVDTHALRVCFNKLALTQKEVSWGFRVKNNAVLQRAYQTVATEIGVHPHVLQAAVWITVKRTLDGDTL